VRRRVLRAGLPTPPKGIVRIDVDAKFTHGWQARVRWAAGNGATGRSRFFSDGAGSPRTSLRRAIDWQAKALDEAGAPQTQRSVRRCRPGQGVFRSTPRREPRGVWVVAYCPAPGVKKSERFSVQRYGERQAKRLALARRLELEIAIYGRPLWPTR